MSTKKVNKSAVLSVSSGKGCYRHIQVSLNESLEELADIILWAFDFCNDHAHAFLWTIKHGAITTATIWRKWTRKINTVTPATLN